MEKIETKLHKHELMLYFLWNFIDWLIENNPNMRKPDPEEVRKILKFSINESFEEQTGLKLFEE